MGGSGPPGSGWAASLSADGRLLLATQGLRSFAYGFLSVLLGPYLAGLGLSATEIGLIFTSALGGGAVATVTLTAVADRLGRRRVLAAGALLMAVGGAAFAVLHHPAWLAAAAVIGTISPSGKEVGPFLALEQAMLPQTTADRHRTHAFALFNLVGSLAGAAGALAVGVPGILGVDALAGYRALTWSYAACGLALAALFTRLSPAVEASTFADGRPRRWGLRPASRPIVARLAGLFALDAFAGGFVVQGFMAYWLHQRFGVDSVGLAGVFFGTNLLAALSFLAAAPVARRIGLLNTMVFTHLPSNVLLVLVPLMPSLPLAVAMLLARHLLSQLDVPTRQSYSMAVVDPADRSAVAGATSVARTTAAAVAPALAGPLLADPVLGAPFLVAGGLKIVYDLLLLAMFRGVRPPEEAAHPGPRPESARNPGGAGPQ